MLLLVGPARTFVEHVVREHIDADLRSDGGAPVPGANEGDLLDHSERLLRLVPGF